MKMNVNKRMCPVYLCKEGVTPILLISPETRKHSIDFLGKKWVDICGDTGYTKMDGHIWRHRLYKNIMLKK
jgi:hypothetical protein